MSIPVMRSVPRDRCLELLKGCSIVAVFFDDFARREAEACRARFARLAE
jgi:hypothetical protein